MQTTTVALRVQQLSYEAENIISVRLVHPAGDTLPGWTPGAHLELVLPSGLVRQYSLCGDPADRIAYKIAVLREQRGRGGSIEIHDSLRAGEVIQARTPRNNFELVDAEDYVLIAGGIGVTPIVAMARQLTGRRSWRLFYGGRSRHSMAFVHQLRTLGDSATVEITPQDELGLLDLDGILAQVKDRTVIYCCGPEPLLRAVEEKCTDLGLADRLHMERFAPSSPTRVGIQDPAASNDGFDVELARTGTTVHVEPGITVLQALRSVKPGIASSCEQGICGACELRVLGGVPDHRDEILSDTERAAGDSMLVCVSRSLTPTLVLDI